MKRSSTSLSNTNWNHGIWSVLSQIKKSDFTRYWRGMCHQFTYCWWVARVIQLEDKFGIFSKVGNLHFLYLTNSTSRFKAYLKVILVHVHLETCIIMLIKAKIFKPSKCLKTERINTLWHIYIMKHYRAIKK